MIIRQILRRRGHRLVPHAWRPSGRRPFASQIDGIERSLQNSLAETHSIETMLQSQSPGIVPSIDDETHRSLDPLPVDVARKHQLLEHHRRTTGGYGSTLAPSYQPHTLLTDPPSPSDITLELLMASQSHLGHSTSLWNPRNSRYIFGIRQGIHIISLDVTAAHLRRACRVVSGVAERGGLILFVGTRPGQDHCVVNSARMALGCHLFEKWIPGSITNGQQILGGCKLKVVNEFDEELHGWEEALEDQPALKPDLVVCLNPLENWVLLHECGLNNIPTIGVIDTDANPTWVTYPIPANDDSLRCIQVIAGVLGRAGEAGQRRRKALAAQGQVLYDPIALDAEKKQVESDREPETMFVDSAGKEISKFQLVSGLDEAERAELAMADNEGVIMFRSNKAIRNAPKAKGTEDLKATDGHAALAEEGGSGVLAQDDKMVREAEDLIADTEEADAIKAAGKEEAEQRRS